jgi:outer membrane lipoprotein-sorting protein
MKKLVIPFILFLFLIVQGFTQGTFNNAEDVDPAAKKILDKLNSKYDSFASLYVDFDLVLELPQSDKEVQEGYIKQEGDKFAAKIGEQEIFCNTKSVWLYTAFNNEVEINDYDPDSSGDFLSPQDMLTLYEDGNYAFAITGEETINGSKVTLIEFKPLDRDSEYSKIRLSVKERSNEPYSIKVFSKDGSRYTLIINDMKPNQKFSANVFEFDASKYTGVRIEDLRID